LALAIRRATSQGKWVMIVGNGRPYPNLNYHLATKEEPVANLELIDDTHSILPAGIYTEEGLQDVLCSIANGYELADPTSRRYGLVILLDHGNKTPNLSRLLAHLEEGTETIVISGSSRRIQLSPHAGKPGFDERIDSIWSETVDPNLLYGKPSVPDFNNLPDEQHARYTADAVLSINDLIPVYEAEARGTTLEDFLAMEIPKRLVLMSLAGVPLFFAESVNEMTARRNTGKTPLSLAWGFHLAAGESFLNFEITRKSVVAYIEGELPASQMQAWLRQQSKELAIPPGGFNLLSRNLNAPSLTIDTEEGRSMVEGWLDQVKAEVAIFDSIKTLSTLSSISEETWGIWNQWFLRLRRKGICVIFLQHTGRGGDQYGSAMQEVALDVSIMLEPTNRNPGGAAFKMTFPKHREEGVLTPCHYQCSGAEWRVVEALTIKTKPPSKEDQVREMLSRDVPQREISEAVQVSPNTISRIKKEMSAHEGQSEATCQ
jgi:putative DNA primase/helicase